ncbi:helicase [Shigella flexneri]|nr:helicase [Shigella flexneri]PQN47525.1 helicase [Shigella flexneri]
MRYFVGCFVGVMMYEPFDRKAKPAANQGIRLPG